MKLFKITRDKTLIPVVESAGLLMRLHLSSRYHTCGAEERERHFPDEKVSSQLTQFFRQFFLLKSHTSWTVEKVTFGYIMIIINVAYFIATAL